MERLEQVRAERARLEELESAILATSASAKAADLDCMHAWAARELRALSEAIRGGQSLELKTARRVEDHVEEFLVSSRRNKSVQLEEECEALTCVETRELLKPGESLEIVEDLVIDDLPLTQSEIIRLLPPLAPPPQLLLDSSPSHPSSARISNASPFDSSDLPAPPPVPYAIVDELVGERRRFELEKWDRVRRWIKEVEADSGVDGVASEDVNQKHEEEDCDPLPPLIRKPEVIDIDVSDLRRRGSRRSSPNDRSSTPVSIIISHFHLNRLTLEEVLESVRTSNSSKHLFLLKDVKGRGLRAVYAQRAFGRFERIVALAGSPVEIFAELVTRVFLYQNGRFVENPISALPLSEADGVLIRQ